MKYRQTYKRLNRLIEDETFEPMLSWGVRMAVSAMVPLIWGLYTHHMPQAIWIILTAEALCWVELKGSFAWRVRTLALGSLLAILFAILGSVTGTNVWLSVAFMFGTAFLATILKNIGDRASGLAICVYLLFIFCNAFPVTTYEAVKERVILVVIGAIWPIFVGMFITAFMPAEEPYRRQIALIWRAIGNLMGKVASGWDGSVLRSNVRDIYQKEKEVRAAIDSSFQFYSEMAHQANKKNKSQYELAQLRKATSLVAVLIIAISEEIEVINLKELDPALRIKLSVLFNTWENAVERMAVYVITLRGEEKLLMNSRIKRLRKLAALVKEYPEQDNITIAKAVKRITLLTERSIKLMESAMENIEKMGKDVPVFKSYSLIKTLFILNPKFLANNLRILFNFNNNTTRYALRSAIAATIALFIYKWFHVDHGYWLPFSVMIVIQPYFGATFKKALDRVLGTLTGGAVAGLFLMFHTSLHLEEVILFISFILMVYYLRKNYAYAAFAVTLNLVLLFNVEAPVHHMLIVTRALCTIGGSALAVIAGFALLPTWDRKWLPVYLANAVHSNYEYFVVTFFSPKSLNNWTKFKRAAEVNNSNVFDSFNRYMQEPTGKERSTLYYEIITHNVRITRALNNYHLEQEDKGNYATGNTDRQMQKINECLEWFNRNLQQAKELDPQHADKYTAYKQVGTQSIVVTDNQMLLIEKLLIELKSMHEDLGNLPGKEISASNTA